MVSLVDGLVLSGSGSGFNLAGSTALPLLYHTEVSSYNYSLSGRVGRWSDAAQPTWPLGPKSSGRPGSGPYQAHKGTHDRVVAPMSEGPPRRPPGGLGFGAIAAVLRAGTTTPVGIPYADGWDAYNRC